MEELLNSEVIGLTDTSELITDTSELITDTSELITDTSELITDTIPPSYMKRFYSRDEIQTIKYHIEQYGVKKKDTNRALVVLLMSQIYLLGSMCMINLQFHIGVVLTSFSLMRLFIVFHDACHNSFFYSQKDNMRLGKWLQYMFPWTYDQWRNGHGEHHLVFGNKNEYDPAVSVITKERYNGLGSREKGLYRVFRDPFIFFCIIPFYLMGVSHHHKSWKSGVIWYSKFGVCWMIGGQFLWGVMLSMYFSLMMGMMLFHLQHTVNVGFLEASNHKNTYYMRNHALLGASMLRIPEQLKWATLGIEYHHIHHFSTRVPCYKLRECHDAGENRENREKREKQEKQEKREKREKQEKQENRENREKQEKQGMWNRVPYIGYRKAIASLFNVYFNEKNGLYETFDEYTSLANFVEKIGNIEDISYVGSL